MVPTLSEDALPERMIGRAGAVVQKSSLSLPRPGLGCGFSSAAFASEEINCMPSYMLATGTTVHFGTGSISSGTPLYCPFLNYERAFSQHDYGLEIAANQCAIDGAWSVRSLQMLYAKAADEDSDCEDAFTSPVSFTCAIDNNVAIINYHWVDHAQTYCMAPVVKFELSRDDHFDQFLIWTEAIGQWALCHLLPEIKKAISLLSDYVSALPALRNSLRKLDTKKIVEEEGLVSALKLTYDNIPWRYDHDDFSPVSSSTASWGSPMVNEAVFAKFEYPIIPQPNIPRRSGSICSDSRVGKGVRFAGLPSDKVFGVDKRGPMIGSLPPALPSIPKPLTPPSLRTKPAKPSTFDEGSELVLKKRMSHAMDEIQDLQSQLVHLKQELNGSTTCIQNELSGLRKTMTCVIRKEKTSIKQRISPLRTALDGPSSLIQTEHRLNIQKGVSVVTTPTEPRPTPWSSPRSAVRKPSGLQNVLTLDTSIEAVSTTTTQSNGSALNGCQSPITIYSPTIINVTNSAESVSALVRVPSHQHNIWSQVAATHVLSALVPSTLLRVLFLGCVLDYCMVSMSGSYTPTLTQYLAHVLETAV
ncbi:hypothetical protein OHC33_008796 [Knufia fluminis]|uniref:DUF7924 domain-containing protein n=1 Tax=Knufia fluminis TaxID=191047 RepID=A0AAN8F2W7_9EURO|nr:hypothetical protein OHC33_008796 [Knufia fluminis]